MVCTPIQCHKLEFIQVQKLQSGFPERESEQGHGQQWKELTSGLVHPWSPSSGSAWRNTLHPWCAAAHHHRYCQVGEGDICEEDLKKQLFSSTWQQHGAQSSGRFQTSSPTLLPFFVHWLITLRKSPDISLIHTAGGERIKVVWKYEWVRGCDSRCSDKAVNAQLWPSCTFYVLASTKGLETLKLSY